MVSKILRLFARKIGGIIQFDEHMHICVPWVGQGLKQIESQKIGEKRVPGRFASAANLHKGSPFRMS